MKNTVKNLISEHRSRDPYKIAKQLGIIVLEENLGSINGYFNEVLGHKFIHINENLPDHLKRFTAAHELGHAILHPNFNHFFLKNYTHFNIDKYEKEANDFAILLICDENINELQTIDEISKFYGFGEKIKDYLYEGGFNYEFCECS